MELCTKTTNMYTQPREGAKVHFADSGVTLSALRARALAKNLNHGQKPAKFNPSMDPGFGVFW